MEYKNLSINNKINIKNKNGNLNMNTKIFISFIIILLFSIFIISVISTVTKKTDNNVKSVNEYSPTSDFYVNDFSNILSDDTKSKIMNNSLQINQDTTAQVVVVTVDSIGNNSIEEFANTLFNNWKIGQKDKNNGVLLIIAKKERKIKIEVGYGLEGAINDAKAGRILDSYAVPYLKNDDYDTGVLKTVDALKSVIYQEYGLASNTQDNYNDNNYNNNEDNVRKSNIYNIIIIILFFFFPFLINIISYFYRRKHPNNWTDHNNFFGGNFFGGGSSNGGFGGGRRLFWRRWFFWWGRSI